MEFKKINPNTIRCILDEEDMLEYDIKLEDFFKNTSSIHEFLHMIVEKAGEEVGYEPKDMSTLSMQIMPLPKNRLAITLTEGPEKSLNSILETLKHAVAGISEEGVEDAVKEYVTPTEEEEMQLPQYQSNSVGDTGLLVAQFSSLSNLEAFVTAAEFDNGVSTSLYYNENNKSYVLVLRRGRATLENFKKTTIKISDYAMILAESANALENVKEYARCIARSRAVELIKSLV